MPIWAHDFHQKRRMIFCCLIGPAPIEKYENWSNCHLVGFEQVDLPLLAQRNHVYASYLQNPVDMLMLVELLKFIRGKFRQSGHVSSINLSLFSFHCINA